MAGGKAPKVKRGHVVPQAYLLFFCDHDEKLQLRLVDEPDKQVVTSPRNAAVRGPFYQRTRPNGETSDDVEASMAVLEGHWPNLVGGLPESWPLGDLQRGVLAEFMALQWARSPAFRTWQRALAEESLAEWEAQGKPYLRHGGVATPEERDLVLHHFSAGTHGLTSMLNVVPKAASALASMHWTLVRFDDPVLATSDHPVVRWPISEGPRPPAPEPDGFGFINLLEVRMALTPSLAVLMTWMDRADAPSPVRGRKHHAANLNSFVVAQAEKQWFHLPGRKPRSGSGRFEPLSADLVPGYNATAAASSARRQRTHESQQRKIGRGVQTTIEMISARDPSD